MAYMDLAQSFGITSEVKELAFPLGGFTEGGIIKSASGLTTDIKRVPLEKLEEAYYKDPITFNTINKGVQMLSASGDRVEYNSPKEEKTFTQFFESLSTVGADCTWEELKNFIWHSEMLFGLAWIELIWDQDDKEIVDLGKLDPKVMDYVRDGNGRVVLDTNFKPLGYTQKIPYGFNAEGMGDKIPENYKRVVSLNSNQIFLLPKRIALIPLFTLSDGYSHIGLIEPAYKSIQRKLMIEEAGTNSAYQRWMNPGIAYVGDDRHPPTSNLANQTLNTMKQMKHDLYSTYPYYVKLDFPDVGKSTEALNDILKYLRENQSSSAGMPLALASGTGEATNRATLNNLQNVMEFTLNDIAKRTTASIMKYIFKPIAESKGLKTYPKMIPNRISIDEIDDFAKRMNNYVKNGNLNAEDVRKMILEKEGVVADKNPPEEKDKKMKKKPNKKKDNEDGEQDTE